MNDMIEKIKEMIKMQKALDKVIYKEHGTQFDEEKCQLAIFDELGELTHELKKEWCWWKKTQAPIDKMKVLEELVDVWHFMLCFHYNTNRNLPYEHDFEDMIAWRKQQGYKLSDYLLDISKGHYLMDLVLLTYHLGFTIDDVYEAYIAKNKINYERLASGY